jgi:hypothetical protein
MKRGTKILLFCLTGGGVFMMLACGGLIYLGMKGLQEIPKVTASADGFMDLIKLDQVDQAYKLTTKEFQAKTNLEQFRSLIAKYPAFSKQTSRVMTGARIYSTGQGVRGYLQYQVANPNNSLLVNLILKDENGSWKVESLNLP